MLINILNKISNSFGMLLLLVISSSISIALTLSIIGMGVLLFGPERAPNPDFLGSIMVITYVVIFFLSPLFLITLPWFIYVRKKTELYKWAIMPVVIFFIFSLYINISKPNIYSGTLIDSGISGIKSYLLFSWIGFSTSLLMWLPFRVMDPIMNDKNAIKNLTNVDTNASN